MPRLHVSHQRLSPFADALPHSHWGHALAPVEVWRVPAGQSVHDAEIRGLYVPALHATQEVPERPLPAAQPHAVAPGELTSPSKHCVQYARPSSGSSLPEQLSPACGAYVFVMHTAHAAWSVEVLHEHVPPAHGAHAVLPQPHQLPAGQAAQLVAPATVLTVPGRHGAQPLGADEAPAAEP